MHLGVGARDLYLLAALFVGLSVEGDSHEGELLHYALAGGHLILSHTSGEDNHIDPSEHCGIGSDIFQNTVFNTTDVTGKIELPEGTEMVMPGDNVEFTVELIKPVAIEKGTKFTIREGGKTVGAGQVTEILD